MTYVDASTAGVQGRKGRRSNLQAMGSRNVVSDKWIEEECYLPTYFNETIIKT